MAVITTKPKGTQDILPVDGHKWQFVESVVSAAAAKSGFSLLRTPIFEHTELFLRGVGDTTDIVNKEMYTFLDKGERSITLRPEGTAGALRAAIENGLVYEALPVRIYYLGPCFRYEKPQAGRFRQFHQFGVEMLGPAGYAADCEAMSLGVRILKELGLQNVSLEINSIGCKDCRKEYQKALVSYFEGHKDVLCPTCLERLEKNPMRILDCKCPECKAVAKDAPTNLSYLCGDCEKEFASVKEQLSALGIPFAVNERIVRGLDYYTRTVFEFVTGELGSQSAVGGGGRYNGLVSDLGGPDIPGVGFAMGMERLVMLMEKQGCAFPEKEGCEVCFIPLGEAAVKKAAVLAAALREEGFSAEYDLMGRSIKAQMKYADRIGAKYTIVMGDNELAEGKAKLRDMSGGAESEVVLTAQGVLDLLYQQNIDKMFGEIAEAAEQMGHKAD